MKTQLAQMKGTWDSLKGGRGMSNILNDDLMKQFLPKDYWTTAQAIRNGSGDFAGITGNLATLLKNYQTRTCAELNPSPEMAKACQQQWNNMAMNQQFGDMAYKKAAQNIDDLQKYIQAINTSADAKTIAEINARLAVEQVRMQNEHMKLVAMQKMEDASRQLEAEKLNNRIQAGLQDTTEVQF